MNPRPFGRIALALATLLLAFGLILGGALAWIQSEPGSKWLLERIQAAAEAQPGVKLEVQEGKLSVFSGLTLRGLKMGVQRDGMNLSVEIPRVETHYSIAWLSRSLTVHDFTLDGMKVSGSIALPEAQTPVPSEPTSWSSLQEQLNAPPASADLQNVSIQNASVDLKIERRGTQPLAGTFRLTEADAELSGGLHPGKISGKMKLNLDQASNRITIRTRTPGVGTEPGMRDEIELTPNASLDGEFELSTPSQSGAPWNFDLKGEKNLVRFSNVVFNRAFENSEKAPWRMTLKEQSLEASARATPEKITLTLKQSSSPVLVKMERAFPPLQPGFTAQFNTTPTLNQFNFESVLSLNQVQVLRLNGTGGMTSDGTRLELNGTVHSDSRLSPLAPALKSYPAFDLGMTSELWVPVSPSSKPQAIQLKQFRSTFLGAPFVTASMTTELDKKNTSAEGSIELNVPQPLFGFLKRAGVWKPAERPILEEAEKGLQKTALSTNFKATQNSDGSLKWEGLSRIQGMGPIAGASFPRGMELKHTFEKSITPNGLQPKGNLHISIPLANWKDEVEATDTEFEAGFRGSDKNQTATELTWKIAQKTLTARDPSNHKPIPLEGLASKGEISIRESGAITGRGLTVSLHKDLLRAEANLSGNQKTGRAELSGTVRLIVPPRFPDIAGNHLAGGLELPWTIQVRDAREILLQGDLRFLDLAWSNGRYGFKGLSGRVPMTESLIREGDSIRLARITTPNAFERVDFERIQPYLLESRKTTLLELQLEDRKIGPFFGFLSVDQNLLSVNQFNLKLGSEGRAYGEFYVDANPTQMQMGILSRVTGLDLGELLPSRMLKRSAGGSKRVAGRTGLVINLTKNSVDGRIDITEIGGSQLVTLLRALDPKGKDEKISRATTALGIAYPTFVGMTFNKGQMDMKVDMSLPAPSMNIRGIPLAGAIASAFSPMRALLARAGYSSATSVP